MVRRVSYACAVGLTHGGLWIISARVLLAPLMLMISQLSLAMDGTGSRAVNRSVVSGSSAAQALKALR